MAREERLSRGFSDPTVTVTNKTVYTGEVQETAYPEKRG